MSKARILLADDHSLVLQGFQKLLEADYDLVGMVEDGRALVQRAQILRPDVILLDISMPLLNGIEAARQLKKILPDTKLVFLTMHADPTYLAEAFRAGGSAYILKRSAVSELGIAIQAALKGRFYVSPLVNRGLVPSTVRPDRGRKSKSSSRDLTPRQREVLQLVAEGHSTKQIANQLSISIKTIEFHKSRIMDQLGIRTTAELTKYAIAHGIVAI